MGTGHAVQGFVHASDQSFGGQGRCHPGQGLHHLLARLAHPGETETLWLGDDNFVGTGYTSFTGNATYRKSLEYVNRNANATVAFATRATDARRWRSADTDARAHWRSSTLTQRAFSALANLWKSELLELGW